MLNIVIPMAGRGSRFSNAGYEDPKPLIKVHGVEMIRVVINNIMPIQPHRFIFICQAEHVRDYDLLPKLTAWAPGSIVVAIDGVTAGAACTVLKARDYINNGNPLMIANSDQFVDVSINSYLEDMKERGLSGLIMTMAADDPKWSYAAVDGDGFVTRVVEKEVISNNATVGIYNFARGSDFVDAAESMIDRDIRVNGEFYVAPVYNQMVQSGAKIGIYEIGSERNGMYGLGIPEDLDYFLSTPLSHQVV
jgi:dTDP-glucose pyrophosphorylase